MSVLARFAPQSGTIEQYDETISKLSAGGDFPPDGLELHVCFVGSDGKFRVSEIWDSDDKMQAFGERLMPLLAEIGIDAGEPEFFEIHNVIRR
jgi:hypothetical protein